MEEKEPKPLEQQEKETKPFYKSKTYGFGSTLMLLGVALFGLPEFKSLVEALPVEYQAAAFFVIGVLTIAFRRVTKMPAVGPGYSDG